MTTAVSFIAILFSVLVPQKTWVSPAGPLSVTVQSGKDVTLELIDFTGKVFAAKGSADVAGGKTADLKTVFPDTANPGTFVLFAVPKGGALSQSGPPKDFLGTPLVIEVSGQAQNPQATMVTHILPLQYVVMTTDAGPLTEVFYYDVAPHTVQNFLELCSGGYYDGLIFHRVIPGFVIQGGDPVGDGSGGPGYSVGSEFNDHPHLEGVLSMARASDPNSAGSQFFVCLDYAKTQQLDHQYTAFGKVVNGMENVKKIAAGQTDPSNDRPVQPIHITKTEIFPVTAQNDPYTGIISGGK